MANMVCVLYITTSVANTTQPISMWEYNNFS